MREINTIQPYHNSILVIYNSILTCEQKLHEKKEFKNFPDVCINHKRKKERGKKGGISRLEDSRQRK